MLSTIMRTFLILIFGKSVQIPEPPPPPPPPPQSFLAIPFEDTNPVGEEKMRSEWRGGLDRRCGPMMMIFFFFFFFWGGGGVIIGEGGEKQGEEMRRVRKVLE